jgi:hypothetical protein
MLHTRRRNKITRPEEDRTLKQWGAECRDKGGIEPMGKIFLLTFLFIGLSFKALLLSISARG